MNNKLFTTNVFGVVFVLIGVIYFVVVSAMHFNPKAAPEEAVAGSLEPGFSYEYYALYLRDLAKQNGAALAMETLISAGPIEGIDTHLLGHVVGDELYIQEGIDGMQYCTDDLGYACSHSIVIGALLEHGVGVFHDIHEACGKAPGAGGYGMCFHGFGHGVLAYVEYELPEAIQFCKRVGTYQFYNEEYVECVGGVVMELRDGFHDQDSWSANGQQYITEDPTEICTAEYMPSEVKEICYFYLTPFLLDAVGYKWVPDTNLFTEAMRFCESEPDDLLRGACYRGFGKEFPWFAHGGDMRQVPNTSDDQFRLIEKWCQAAPTQYGSERCIESVMSAFYRKGLYEKEIPQSFCNALQSNPLQATCYNQLLRSLEYARETVDVGYCSSMPDTLVEQCLELDT